MKISEELKYLFDLLGYEKTCEISKKLAKKQIYFPKDKNQMDKKIKSAFGRSFNLVHKEFLGTTIYFPLSLESEEIRRKIRKDYWENKMSYFLIAKKYQRTIDNVRKICKENNSGAI
jgi:hypothetical protein